MSYQRELILDTDSGKKEVGWRLIVFSASGRGFTKLSEETLLNAGYVKLIHGIEGVSIEIFVLRILKVEVLSDIKMVAICPNYMSAVTIGENLFMQGR
ncbi:MAG: hypothetical protein LBR92_01540 [Puniceicoccales bacterium]|jgi:hypothetical protein|nr:hypothetical protein [Puniceicoccales bacterium]